MGRGLPFCSTRALSERSNCSNFRLSGLFLVVLARKRISRVQTVVAQFYELSFKEEVAAATLNTDTGATSNGSGNCADERGKAVRLVVSLICLPRPTTWLFFHCRLDGVRSIHMGESLLTVVVRALIADLGAVLWLFLPGNISLRLLFGFS